MIRVQLDMDGHKALTTYAADTGEANKVMSSWMKLLAWIGKKDYTVSVTYPSKINNMPQINGKYIQTTTLPKRRPSDINVWYRWIRYVNFLRFKYRGV